MRAGARLTAGGRAAYPRGKGGAALLLELLPFAAEQDAAAVLLGPLLTDRNNVGLLRKSLGFHLERDWQRFQSVLVRSWAP